MARGRDDINVASIKGVDWLKWEDQEKLRKRIRCFKENKSPTPDKPMALVLDFISLKSEISATSRGKCGKCSVCFEKGQIKFWNKKWLHAACLFGGFDQVVGDLRNIPRWIEYSEEARKEVEKEFEKVKKEKEKERTSIPVEKPAIPPESSTPEDVITISYCSDSDSEESPPIQKRARVIDDDDEITVIDEKPVENKKIRTEKKDVENDSQEDEMAKKRRLGREAKLAELKNRKMKKQADKLWEYRALFENVSMSDRQQILVENDQDIPEGHDPTAQVMDRLVDNALFGCPIGCPQCPNGKIVYNSARRTYVCTGYATEYSRCQYEHKNPIRTPFKLPDRIFKKYKMEQTVFNEMSERLYVEQDEQEQIIVRAKKGAKNPEVIFAAEAFDGNHKVPATLAGVTTTNTHIIKNGTLVDAKFPYARDCHVHKDEQEGFLYQATLSFTDLTQNKNSYYKLQLLKNDISDMCYVFRSWGRVGTEVGDWKFETYGCLSDAVEQFEVLFQEKTGNEWKYRKYFRKVPGLFNYVETDFSEFEELSETDVIPGSKSLLPASVKQIVLSIFDVENMKSALKSFEMDVNKMPLGKLSKNQIDQAFGVLTELGDLLAEHPVPMSKVVDATNKFYTVIPHNFGMKVPEPIDTLHKVKEKNNMLTALLDIKFAYDQICGGTTKKVLKGVDPVDTNYEKLKCEMTPLERGCEDWNHVEEFMKNTCGSTHHVNVSLLDIHRLKREGEAEKFKADLGNRMLLWHGSGRMNYAGILGQGLRIAPPEAPVTGYMFGKGVYFADMFSKSFFYCRHDHTNEAYLLLCDVALGNTHNLFHATTVSKKTLPNGTSSVKGNGREVPNAADSFKHPDGYVIPKGKGVSEAANNLQSSLIYNEYIVYDVDQIQLKYLVRVKINYANRHV